MEISMNALALSLVWALVVGICLGAVYDVIRIQRIFLGVTYGNGGAAKLGEVKLPLISKYKFARPRDKKQKNKSLSKIALNIIIFIGDLIFCFFSSLVCVVFIYHTNDGKARWIVFFGFALGFLAYYFSLGKLVMFFSQYIVFAIRSAVKYLVFFTVVPVRYVLAALWRIVSRIHYKVRAKRYTRSETKKIMDASKIGFIG